MKTFTVPLPTHVGQLLHALGVDDLVPTAERRNPVVCGICIFDYTGPRSVDRARAVDRIFVLARYPDEDESRRRIELLAAMLEDHRFGVVLVADQPLLAVRRSERTSRRAIRNPLLPAWDEVYA